MSTQVTTAFAQKFASNVGMLIQQKPSRLAGAVRTENFRGVKGGQVVQQIGATAAVKRTTRHADTVYSNTPHDVRWVYPEDYQWADLIDREDALKTLADFEGPYTQNAVAAMNRAKDDEVIAAFFSDTTKTGETGGTTTDWTTFVAANTAHKIVSSSLGLTVSKLQAAIYALQTAEVDIENDMIFCAITAKQIRNLFQETQVVSLDYNTSAVLVDGKIKPFMGINFIHSERLATASSEHRVPIWAKSGMALATWNDVATTVDRMPGKNNATQVYAAMSCGATRLEEKKVVEVLCA